MRRRKAIIYMALTVIGIRNSFASQKLTLKDWKKFLNPANRHPIQAHPKLETANKEWQIILPKRAYRVLFEEDTEPRFSSILNEEKRRGLYECRACGLALFTSEMKYDSGTGWPSFFSCISDHIETKTDYKIIIPRTEYHCKKCGGHQGHVFKDGPAPTYERWCNNGISLAFVPTGQNTNQLLGST